MKNIYQLTIAISTFSLLSSKSNAQLPPVTFSGKESICDTTPWKLVFYDEFEGKEIDRKKWYTYNSNNGGQDDNWCEARVGYPGNQSIHRDENVVVSDGTLKLKVIQQTNTWQCKSCDPTACTPGAGDKPVTKNYTSGYISSTTTYNNGKIEAKVRLPTFQYSWATGWTWHLTSVNEIDFLESWGGSNGYKWPYVGNRRRNTYTLHAWAPRDNPYSLPDHISIGNTYPQQTWWNWLSGKHHEQDEWHTYTCEWDTACIKFYLDGQLINTVWKYYRKKGTSYTKNGTMTEYKENTPSGCQPEAGIWNITEGFPYNNESFSKLIFSVGMTKFEKVLDQDGELGQMEIDYIKVYQRHPEQDHHQEIKERNN